MVLLEVNTPASSHSLQQASDILDEDGPEPQSGQ